MLEQVTDNPMVALNRAAAARTTSLPEQQYLTKRAAQLRAAAG